MKMSKAVQCTQGFVDHKQCEWNKYRLFKHPIIDTTMKRMEAKNLGYEKDF